MISGLVEETPVGPPIFFSCDSCDPVIGCQVQCNLCDAPGAPGAWLQRLWTRLAHCVINVAEGARFMFLRPMNQK